MMEGNTAGGMPTGNLLWGGAILGALAGVVAGFWAKIKDWLLAVVSLVFETVSMTEHNAFWTVHEYLLATRKSWPVRRRIFRVGHYFRRDRFLWGEVPLEYRVTPMLFLKRGLPLWWTPGFSAGNAAPHEPGGSVQHSGGTITFIRGTVNVDLLLQQAVAYHASRQKAVADEFKRAEGQYRTCERYGVHYVAARADGSRSDGDIAKTAGYHAADLGLPEHYLHRCRMIGADWRLLASTAVFEQDTLARLFFPPEVVDSIQEVKTWKRAQHWYAKMGIPWKRGWLLFGPPGTGKSALIRSIAQDLDMPVYIFNLAGMTNSQFLQEWKNLGRNPPCIVAIEDIDNVFDKRKNLTAEAATAGMWASGMMAMARRPHGEGRRQTGDPQPESKAAEEKADYDDGPAGMGGVPLTFDTFINAIDGVNAPEGVFLIITTNNLEKVDPALGNLRVASGDGNIETLSTRPGRVDKIVKLGPMTEENREKLVHRLLADYPDGAAKALELLVADGGPHTPAQVQEVCLRIALVALFEGKLKLDEPCVWADGEEDLALKKITNGKVWLTGTPTGGARKMSPVEVAQMADARSSVTPMGRFVRTQDRKMREAVDPPIRSQDSPHSRGCS